MNVKNKYNIADRVYMITDPEQRQAMVLCIVLNPNGIMYQVVIAGEIFDCFEIELSTDRNVF